VATYQAIAATGQAILGLLADSCPKPEFAGARFELYKPDSFHQPMEEGISLFLYRVAVNLGQRNQATRPRPDGLRPRLPLPLDLYYLLTPWSPTPERQQRLLGWAMRTLEDTPILPAGHLNHYAPEPNVFQPAETVELFYEAISLQDMATMWEVFKPHEQLSIPYVARMVSIESTQGTRDAERVQTRVLEVGQWAVS
jgi:hypothetical protein